MQAWRARLKAISIFPAGDNAVGRRTNRARGHCAALAKLSTANLADALVRLGRPVRLAPFEVRPLTRGKTIFGPARPVQHFGSVDIFLEVLGAAQAGDVIVIDNRGRRDEGTIGDQIVREFKHAGLAGVVLWGAHRDTKEILDIGLPLWSLGACPAGPARAVRRNTSALRRARIGDAEVSLGDVAVADDDGAIFFRAEDLEPIVRAATAIRERETAQAARQNKGAPLRRQFRFEAYLARRKKDPALTFRGYLKQIEGEIET